MSFYWRYSIDIVRRKKLYREKKKKAYDEKPKMKLANVSSGTQRYHLKLNSQKEAMGLIYETWTELISYQICFAKLPHSIYIRMLLGKIQQMKQIQVLVFNMRFRGKKKKK